jgi:hypothetical protein
MRDSLILFNTTIKLKRNREFLSEIFQLHITYGGLVLLVVLAWGAAVHTGVDVYAVGDGDGGQAVLRDVCPHLLIRRGYSSF